MNATTARIPASSLTAQSLRPEDHRHRPPSGRKPKHPISKLLHANGITVGDASVLLGCTPSQLSWGARKNRYPQALLDKLVDLFGIQLVLDALNTREREIHAPGPFTRDATDTRAFVSGPSGWPKGRPHPSRGRPRRRGRARRRNIRDVQWQPREAAPQGMTPPPEVAVLAAPTDGHVLAISTLTDGKLVAMDAWLASLNVDQTLRVLERVRELDAKVRARLSDAMDDVVARVEAAVGPPPPAKQGY